MTDPPAGLSVFTAEAHPLAVPRKLAKQKAWQHQLHRMGRQASPAAEDWQEAHN